MTKKLNHLVKVIRKGIRAADRLLSKPNPLLKGWVITETKKDKKK